MENKKWLVDARELLVEIERIYDDHYYRSNDKTVHDIFGAIRRRVRRYAKFLDTVEVVRCKDCIHFDPVKALRPGGIWCEYWGTDPDQEDWC